MNPWLAQRYLCQRFLWSWNQGMLQKSRVLCCLDLQWSWVFQILGLPVRLNQQVKISSPFVLVYGYDGQCTGIPESSQVAGKCTAPESKGGEIRDTKTLNLVRNIVSLQVLADVSRFSPCVINLSHNKNIWRKLLRKVECGSTLCNKFWLCCSFFIKLTTWRATNLLAFWQINQSERYNKCFCCGSSWSCKVKNATHRPKLATKQCCATSWGFLYLVLRRLKRKINKPCLLPLGCILN